MTAKKRRAPRKKAAAAPFDRRRIFSDTGELEHVVYLFDDYRNYPPGLGLERGPYPRLVELLSDYLRSAGTLYDPSTLSADWAARLGRLARRIDIAAAYECLSLLLSHPSPKKWTAGAVADLRARLYVWYAIVTDTQAQKADRSLDAARGPRIRKAPIASKIIKKDAKGGAVKAESRATEVGTSRQYVSRVRKGKGKL